MTHTMPYSEWVAWRRCWRKRRFEIWGRAAIAMHKKARELGEDPKNWCVYGCIDGCGGLHYGHKTDYVEARDV